MAGMEPGALSGLSYNKLPLPLARSLALLTQATFAARERVSGAYVLPVKDVERSFMATCTPFWDEDNEMTGVVSIYNDVTALDEAHEKTRKLAWTCVDVFAKAMEAVDPYLSGRASMLADLAPPLAAALGEHDKDRATTLRVAARLSRVGMLRLFANSPHDGLLDESGKAALRRHVDYAREALEGIDFGLPVLEAVTGMYERMDGSGYPAGLKGDEINLNSRILGAADAFCAMIRPRSYRKVYTPRQALEELAASPGFDHTIIAALRDILHTPDGLKILVDSVRAHKG
jgi:HD-GYP domain-containing protein (c-di-GMP phosphodiesterase class II)